MPIRAWGYVAALGLILATSGQAQEQTESPEGQAAGQEQPAQALPIPLPVDIVEDEAAAKTREREEEEARRREIDDLAAQEGMNAATQAMNEATQRMAEYAFWSTVLVGVGTVLLIATLWLTRQANNAAQAAVTVTRDIGQAQSRAYVRVEWAKLFENGENVRLMVQVHNQGQTPALAINVSGQSESFDTRGYIPPPSFDRNAEGLDWGALGPNETIYVPVEYPHLTRDYSAVYDGDGFIAFRVSGLVRYRTMFNALCETEFSFHTKARHHMFKRGPTGAIEDDPIILSRAPYPLQGYRRIDKPESQRES